MRTTRLAWTLLSLLGLAAAVDGALLARAAQWNRRIAAGSVPADAESPVLRFAAAHALAASDAADAALSRYRAVQDDAAVGLAARYNAANLLLRQAVEVRAGAQPGQAIALVELAKEGYRELLRHDPEHWDARYNLERAQRLLPDPDDADDEAAAAPRERERAATTMRAQSLGLP